ncbi:MAG: hypothetical protein J0H28_15665 [Methylibium petroleiphilum]|nr:hypothetical protein [Methylibium petroleiphilum]
MLPDLQLNVSAPEIDVGDQSRHGETLAERLDGLSLPENPMPPDAGGCSQRHGAQVSCRSVDDCVGYLVIQSGGQRMEPWLQFEPNQRGGYGSRHGSIVSHHFDHSVGVAQRQTQDVHRQSLWVGKELPGV